MKAKIVSAVTLATALLAAGDAMAQAQQGPWMVRLRATHIDSANTDKTGLGLTVSNKTIPEFDIGYFINKNLALELVTTVPQKHNVALGGTKIGTLREFPPTLLVQYHFDAPGFRPYVGAGVNYTHFGSIKLPVGVDVQRNSFGAALQVGVDFPLSGNLYLNLDLKKIYMQTDVKIAGVNMGALKVDPVLASVGLGWRF